MARTKSDDPVSAAALATLSPIGKSATHSLSDRVYEELLRLIVEGLVPIGQNLPTEADFCNRFGVSRTVVREALSRLKFDGLIASSHGRQSVVLKQPFLEVLESPQVASITDVQRFLEFRQLVEREAAALAAERAQPADLKRIRQAHEAQLAAFARHDNSVDHDLAFHITIVSAAHNHFLSNSLISVQETFRSSMAYVRRTLPRNFEARAARIIDEHSAIVGAIEARDPGAARTYMAYHLQRGKERIFAGADFATLSGSPAS